MTHREKPVTTNFALSHAICTAYTEVKRKRRVLKKLTTQPSATPEMSAMVFVEEGNCPSDGCSLVGSLRHSPPEGCHSRVSD